MRSCTGSASFSFHCLTQWYHGGQSIASNSTLQSELIGASTTADKAEWFYHFMKSYPFLFGVKSAPSIPLFIDNQACLSVTNHPNISTKSRHIALREFRIRDYHELGMIRPYWCPGNYNVADFFSKLLERGLFTRACSQSCLAGRDRMYNAPVAGDNALEHMGQREPRGRWVSSCIPGCRG